MSWNWQIQSWRWNGIKMVKKFDPVQSKCANKVYKVTLQIISSNYINQRVIWLDFLCLKALFSYIRMMQNHMRGQQKLFMYFGNIEVMLLYKLNLAYVLILCKIFQVLVIMILCHCRLYVITSEHCQTLPNLKKIWEKLKYVFDIPVCDGNHTL